MKDQLIPKLGAGHPWAGSVQHYSSIDSTNNKAKSLAEIGAPHGTVLIADHQTNGRGRTGNTFYSPENSGIYLSVILRPDCHAGDLMHLTCAVGVAVCDAIEAVSGFRPGIKWINDLIAQKKKLGGILTELALAADGTVQYAVVGIGINCNQTQDMFPSPLNNIATSIQLITGKELRRADLVAELIRSLEIMSCQLFTDKKRWMDRYRQDCITIGQNVMVMRDDKVHYGTALYINDDGTLRIQWENGIEETLHSGDVHVRGLYGYC